jgi:uncharacterized protein YjiS (DUF1127 family)
MTSVHSIGGPLRAIALWAGKGIPSLWRKLAMEVIAWNEAARLRHLARSLDERTLQDIGLSRADIEVAAGKLRQWRYL